MAKFVALYQNLADSAGFTGGDWLPALPLSNLRHPDVGLVARSVSAAPADTQFVTDIGVSRPVGGVALGPTNMSPGATYRIRGYADPTLTTLVHDTGILAMPGGTVDWSDPNAWLEWEDPGFWFGIPDIFDLEAVPAYAFAIFDEDVSAQFWKVEVTDPENAEGYVQFGRLLIGRAFRPSVNYEFGAEFGVRPLFDRQEALSGKRTDWDRGRRRYLRVSFGFLGEGELFSEVFRLSNVSGVSRQIFVVPDPGDPSTVRKRSFLATFNEAPPLVQAFLDHGSTVIDCEEVL